MAAWIAGLVGIFTGPAEPVGGSFRSRDERLAGSGPPRGGFSAGDAAEWDRLIGALEAFELDLVIAAAGEATSRTVIHYDAHFDHLGSVTGQATEWIVPRGTIDWWPARTTMQLTNPPVCPRGIPEWDSLRRVPAHGTRARV